LLLGAKDELRIAMRYAIRHLSDRDPSGALVSDVLARAPAELLEGGGPVVEGLSGHRWPLRAAGLAAAAAVAERRNGGASAALLQVVGGAVDAFREVHGSGTSSWALRPTAQSSRAKRRRLLLELRDLPQHELFRKGPPESEMEEKEFQSLCLAARDRLDIWLQGESNGGR